MLHFPAQMILSLQRSPPRPATATPGSFVNFPEPTPHALDGPGYVAGPGLGSRPAVDDQVSGQLLFCRDSYSPLSLQPCALCAALSRALETSLGRSV